MKTFASAVAIAITLWAGTINADAAGYSTTKSQLKGLAAEQCDPKTDKDCAQPAATINLNSSKSNAAREVKVLPQSEDALKVSPEKRTGSGARVAAPCDPKATPGCKDAQPQGKSKI